MSDVERICEANYQRVRWAEEYDREGRETRIATAAKPPRNDRGGRKDRQRRIFRTASLGCAMFCGMGTAYLGLGVAMWHLPTMVAGIVAAVVFLVAGWRLDEKVEEMTV